MRRPKPEEFIDENGNPDFEEYYEVLDEYEDEVRDLDWDMQDEKEDEDGT